MLARELRIALRSPVAWLVAALGALLVGHGFVLAIDIYSAGSRSVAASRLMAREFDPLLGIVRPTFGGLYVAASILVPILAARPISIEKERRSFRALVHTTGAPSRVVLVKLVAALAASSLLLVGPIAALATWRALGGHLSLSETLTVLVGHLLYLALLASVATAASSWTRSMAQAVTLTMMSVIVSWAIDAAEGFSALAWLGRAVSWSLTTHVAPFERGTFALGSFAWFVAGIAGALALALIGARFDLAPRVRVGAAMLVVFATIALLASTSHLGRAYDTTEGSRLSLPPAVVRGLRDIREPIRIEAWLDRDDSRRRQAESDVFARLRLARPDIEIVMPLDRAGSAEALRDEDYGRIVVSVGGRVAETRSTSRREIATLVFETAGRPVPANAQAEYPGYPLVIEGRRRVFAGAVAYGVTPGILLVIGLAATRIRRRLS